MIGSPLRKKVMLMVMLLFIPDEKWVPKRVDFKEEGAKRVRGSTEALPSSNGDEHCQVIETPEGQLTITFTPKKKERAPTAKQPQAFGHVFFYRWSRRI